ncbi:MAG: metalloregulator ArsR/SmtB family transcription factor [Verrucomicrobiae bacterium]|nr:metalloregulator ArsR/SmtB family transcription factor [Verrucomicrobiae bacterium]
MGKKPVSRVPADQGLHVIAARFRLLGDVNRLKIIELLDDGVKERSLPELRARLRMSQAMLMKHLRALTSAGVLGRRKEGNTVWYSLIDPSVNELCDLVSESVQQRLAAHFKHYEDYEL